MKNTIIFVLLISFAVLPFSCKNNGKSAFPEIINPTYKMYDKDGERGYRVQFIMEENYPEPYAVIINKIQQKVEPNNISGNHYEVNIIAQSIKIHNYQPKIVEKSNGIIFKKGKDFIFQKVDFKLIK